MSAEPFECRNVYSSIRFLRRPSSSTYRLPPLSVPSCSTGRQSVRTDPVCKDEFSQCDINVSGHGDSSSNLHCYEFSQCDINVSGHGDSLATNLLSVTFACLSAVVRMLNPFYSGMGVLVSIFSDLSPVLWPPGYVRFPAYVWDGWGWFFVEGNDVFSQCYTNVSRRGDSSSHLHSYDHSVQC